MNSLLPSCFSYLRLLCLVALIGLCATPDASAQNSKKAKSLYEKAIKATNDKDYVKVITLYAEVISEELAYDDPDHAFLGSLLDQMGSIYSQPDYYHIAADYYFYAAIQHAKADSADKAKWSLYYSSNQHDSLVKYDGALKHDFTKSSKIKFDFPVKSIISVKGDTTWFHLGAGSNQGVEVGQTGWILTRHDTDPDRGNQEFGKYGVKEVHNTYSLCWAVKSESAAKMVLLTGDNVEVLVPVPDATFRGVFYELSKLNITFVDDYRQPIYRYDQILNVSKASSEEAFLTAMREIIYGTAISLYDPNDTEDEYHKPLESGLFKGKNMWEAMLTCTNDDVRIFLEFVVSFPAKYMGRGFRIDETFATWVINNTPLASEAPAEYTKEFLSIQDLDSLKNWIKINQSVVWSEGLEIGKISDHIYQNMADSAFDRADVLIKLMLQVTNDLGMDSMNHEFMNAVGQLYMSQEKYPEAIDAYKAVLKIDPENGNTHWYLGNAYYSDKDYKHALDEFKIIMEKFPYWAGGHGLYGWTLIKQGNFPEAFEHCHKAYTLDSFNTSYIMNLGHAHLLLDRPTEARKLYIECLENMDYVSSFTDGLMDDFEFFIKRSWKVQQVKNEQKFLYEQWNNHYKFKVMANEAYEKGKTLKDNEEHLAAAKEFDKAAAYEMKGETVRYDWLRTYERWSAYNYYKSNDYKASLDHYRKGWDISRTYLNNLEYEISDLENVGNLYSWLDDDVKLDMYRKMQYAVQRKLQNQSRSNKLYIISIGVNSFGTSGYVYAEKDARALAETIREKSKLVFDETSVAIFDSSNTSLANIAKAFQSVISKSRPGDCFILYYSGYCPKENDGSMIIGADTLKNENLLGWLRLMQADKKLILMDAANASLIQEYSAGKELSEDLFHNENLTFILSDGRIELPDDVSGLFTSHLINGISGKAFSIWGGSMRFESAEGTQQLGQITAKGIEGYMYGKMNKSNMQFELKSYSYGADFPIAYTDQMASVTDTIPPMIYVTGTIGGAGTRGGKSKKLDSDENLYGQAVDASGIEQVLVNGEAIEFTQNGKFSLPPEYLKSWKKLVIKAKDKNGLWGMDSVYLDITTGNPVPLDFPGENREGTRYALLFATNEYDNWTHLGNPVNDAREIGSILEREYGFKVDIRENKTKREMEEVIDEYLFRDYTDKDQLFVFFAGHGISVPYRGGMVVCKDSDKEDAPGAYRSYLSLNEIQLSLNNLYKCRNIMLTLDICFGGVAFDEDFAQFYSSESVRKMKEDPEKCYKSNLGKTTRLFLTSGDSTPVSDGASNHSPFAERFISTLKEHSPEKGGLVTLIDFVNNMQFVEDNRQEIKYGTFGDNDPGADFIFMYRGNEMIRKTSNVAATGFQKTEP